MALAHTARNELVPLILAGGRGTRLWPVSRDARPKHFLKLAHGRSLLQDTLLRAAALQPQHILIATHDEHYFQTEEEIAAIAEHMVGVHIHYLLEPESRDTGPAIAMAVRYLHDLCGPEAQLLVLPSDHLIEDIAAFCEAVAHARQAATEGALVTLGVEPREAETAFGYIECSAKLSGVGAQAAGRFIEKPRQFEAQTFVDSGRYAWNSGIFCFSVSSIEAALAQKAPEIACRVEPVWQESRSPANLANATRFAAGPFAEMPEISIDYAVLEKADNVAVVRADMDWCDVGSWDALSRLSEPDAAGNQIFGQAVLINSRNNYVQADGRLVAAVGVEGLVIVDTPDALLVGRRGDGQQVRQVVAQLRQDGHDAGLVHRTVHRPWGTYTVIGEGEHYKVKRLQVKPGAALSLQMHRHRDEHWVVIEGVAKVINGDETFELGRHESTYIPAGNRHRIENPGSEDVIIIETQTGNYLGEDDIVRFQDDYGRTAY